MTDVNTLPPVLKAETVADLLTAMQPVTLVDVRTPVEFMAQHIPGSINIPLDQLSEHAPALSATLRMPAVLVCRSGNRANQAATMLQAAELPQLHILDGGILAWEAAQLPLKIAPAPWSMERQVRGIAGSLVLAGSLTSLFWRPAGLLPLFVGGGLAYAALTDSCMMARILGKLPFNQQPACDMPAVIKALSVGAE